MRKDHQESDDRCSGVDEKLPGVGVVEVGSRQSPHDDGEEGNQKGPIGTNRMRGLLCRRRNGSFMSQLLVVAPWRCTSARMTEHAIEERPHAKAMDDLWRERLHGRADRARSGQA